MPDQAPLSWTVLQTLAPTHLALYRSSRFMGDTLSVALHDFVGADRQILQRVYQTLGQLLDVLAAAKDARVGGPTIEESLQQIEWGGAVRSMQQFGKATITDHSSPQLNAVIHDLRGGSFLALSVTLQLLTRDQVQPNQLLQAFFLARDHLKMMRNAVPDLDRPQYERDRAQKAHRVQLLVEKWSQATYQLDSHRAVVVVDAKFDGNVSERCIEFAALDRVLYNLLNNAVRHAADQHVYLTIFQVDEHNVRFVVYNRMTAEQSAVLRERFGDNLGSLFEGGFTTGGTGLGLRICAEFVADAYGVHGLQRCLAEGYIGARNVHDYFVTWFHWPVAAD